MYKCYIDDDLMLDDVIVLDASQSILRDIGLNDNDTMEMEYDFGSTTTFKIKYLGSREFDLEKNNIKVMKTFPMIKKGYENVGKY